MIVTEKKSHQASSQKNIIKVLSGEKVSGTPFWFMRQAGRYLPEYREIRKKSKNFVELCLTPELATEITLQPVRRYNISAAILFSDILMVPYGLGYRVEFIEGTGPKLEIADTSMLAEFEPEIFIKKLENVFHTVSDVSNHLDDKTALIGFAGAPWTVACYMIEGGGSKDFAKVRKAAASDPNFDHLIDLITKATIHYLKSQIIAGAEVIQIFDSWAGVCSTGEFKKYVIDPTKKIIIELKKLYPEIPVIGFPRGAGVNYISYVNETGVDGIGVDERTSLLWLSDNINRDVAIQGNLDNILLAYAPEKAIVEAKKILDEMKGRRHIFNLGHGVLPETDPETVRKICEVVTSYELRVTG